MHIPACVAFDDIKKTADTLLSKIHNVDSELVIRGKDIAALRELIQQWQEDIIPWESPDEFINEQLDKYSDIYEIDVDVLKFISHMICKRSLGYTELDSLFRKGYCMYFAKMLLEVFGRGWLSITYPIGHVVWQDVSGTCYDIFGVYVPDGHKAKCLIPWNYFPEELLDPFWHASTHGNYDENDCHDEYMQLQSMCEKYVEDFGIM